MCGAAHALTIGEVGKPGWTTTAQQNIYFCVLPLATDQCSSDLLSFDTKYGAVCQNKRNSPGTEASNNRIVYILCWL